LHHALARDNALPMFELLLEHGADPGERSEGLTAVARAAREGRSDVLELFERRGVPTALDGVDRLIAACARGDAAAAADIARSESGLLDQLRSMGGGLLARFAGTCNPAGVERLLDLGVPVDEPFAEGDGYWDEPPGSLAIHIASWRCCAPVVRLLISRGSPVDRPDPKGRTPLALAIKACVDSYWTEYCSPDLIEALLTAGASAREAPFPCGNQRADQVLARYR
jgi:hypothetical protein